MMTADPLYVQAWFDKEKTECGLHTELVENQ